MTTRFLPCPNCNRHVKGADARCPFCEMAMPVHRQGAPTTSQPLGRLSRIAILTVGATLVGGAAGCADSPAKTDAGTGGQTAADGHDANTATGGAGSGSDAGTGGNGATDGGPKTDAPVPIAIYAAAIAPRSNQA